MNFADIPDHYSDYEDATIVVIPVPYDKTSTWVKGASRGPEAILNASQNLELFDIETDSEVYKKGISLGKPVVDGNEDPKVMVSAVYEKVKNHLDKKKFVVALGGEHSITIGAVIAMKEKFEDMTVLQLDAHADMRSQYEGSIYNHACVMARVSELCPVVQVGIRSMDVEEKGRMNADRVVWADEIDTSEDWINRVLSNLSGNVYVTVDLDVFDPSVMPSTGTPEPGGLQWYDVLRLLKKVFAHRNVIGLDVVELCPRPGSHAPDFMAAKLVYKLLSYKYYL